MTRAAIVLFGCAVSATLAAQPLPSLKSLVPRGMLIGAALNERQSDGQDPAAAEIAAAQFNTISPENLLKWERVHPQPDRFNWEPADRYVAYGEQHGMFVVGHNLVWHQQTPAWVFAGDNGQPATREMLLARMQAHISAVVGRYKGRIKGWDVVNEALEEDGSLRKSRWQQIIGDDFIAKAFEFAAKADPSAQLFYNDYNLTKLEKRAGALRIVEQLKAQGLRIDGVGEQGHWLISEPSVEQIDRAISEIGAAGVKVHITELDVDVLPRDPRMYGADLNMRAKFSAETNLYPNGLPPEQQQKLAARYASIFKVFMKHRDVLARVTFWGLTDRDSWLNGFPVPGRVNHPLLWDRGGKPKPAFDAVVQVLQDAKKGAQ